MCEKTAVKVVPVWSVVLLVFVMLGVAIFFANGAPRADKKLESDIRILYRSLSHEYARHALFLFEEESPVTVGEVEYLRALSEGAFESGEQVAYLYREFLRILAERERAPFPDQARSNQLRGNQGAFSYCNDMLRTCNAIRFAENDYRFKGADKVATAILVKAIDKDLSTYAPGKTKR